MRFSFVAYGQGLQKTSLLLKLRLDFSLDGLEHLGLDAIMSQFISVRHNDLTY